MEIMLRAFETLVNEELAKLTHMEHIFLKEKASLL